MAAVPAPISVQPSGNFRGDDGSWSTFAIKAGNPAQDVEVLVSNITPETWIISNKGCNQNSPKDCSTSRGGLFDIDNSTTWKDQKIYSLTSEESLGYSGSDYGGDYGFDALSVPSSNGEVTLDGQVLATIANPTFWLGNLGISPRQVNYNGSPQPSFISNLNSTNRIPSLSYGYTAGASYQSNTTASLTLGGYDQSRFTPNDLFFTFAPSDSGRDLLVGVQSITFSDSDVASSPLLPKTLFALIDSTVPDLWLPVEACTAFEKAFGINWDPLHLKYIVNETVHDALLKQNASVTFQLGNAVDSGPTIDIVLPYASFDLQLGPPIMNTTRYFPLRQAHDLTQYTLGRTFLQEAYLTADYERKNFSISQCTWPAPENPNIVAIYPPKSTGSGTTTATGTSAGPTSSTTSSAKPSPTVIAITQSHSLGTSAIAGIAIAVLIIAILSASTALYMLWWRPRHRKQDLPSTGSCWGSRKNKDGPRDMPPELAGASDYYNPKRGSYFDAIPGAGPGVGHKANKPSETISEVEGTFGMASMSPQIIHGAPVELESDDIRAEMASPETPKRKSTTWTNHLELPSPNPSSIGSGPSPPDQECPDDRLSQVLNNSDAGRTMYPIPSPETEQGSFAGSFRGGRPPTPSAFQSPRITHTRFGSHGSEVGSMTSVAHSPGAFELDSSRLDFPSPQPSPRPEEPLMGGNHLHGGK